MRQEPDPVAPRGSRIAFDRSEGAFGRFRIARAGRSPGDLGGILFAVLWVALVAWGTWNALQASLWLILLSLPFWGVGAIVAHQIVRSLTETQSIVTRADHLEVVKRSAVGNSREVIGYGDIESIGMEREIPLNPVATFRFLNRTEKEGRVRRTVPRLVIRHRARRTCAAEHVSENEMKWLSEALAEVLRRDVRN